jgi:hypothetical protein
MGGWWNFIQTVSRSTVGRQVDRAYRTWHARLCFLCAFAAATASCERATVPTTARGSSTSSPLAEDVGKQRYGHWLEVRADRPLLGAVERDRKGDVFASGPTRDGRKHGYWVQAYSNGSICRLRGYRDGRPHGKWLEWEFNGELSSDQEYRDGMRWRGRFTEDAGGARNLLPGGRGEPWLLDQVLYDYVDGKPVKQVATYPESFRAPTQGTYKDGKPWSGVFVIRREDMDEAYIIQYDMGAMVEQSALQPSDGAGPAASDAEAE